MEIDDSKNLHRIKNEIRILHYHKLPFYFRNLLSDMYRKTKHVCLYSNPFIKAECRIFKTKPMLWEKFTTFIQWSGLCSYRSHQRQRQTHVSENVFFCFWLTMSNIFRHGSKSSNIAFPLWLIQFSFWLGINMYLAVRQWKVDPKRCK
mgnify:FL=1